jgi:hypothetical protein
LQGQVTEAAAIEAQTFGTGPRQRSIHIQNSLMKAIHDINQQIIHLGSH